MLVGSTARYYCKELMRRRLSSDSWFFSEMSRASLEGFLNWAIRPMGESSPVLK